MDMTFQEKSAWGLLVGIGLVSYFYFPAAFDIADSASLPAHVRDRLLDSDDGRIYASGVVVIKSQEHRTQSRNRDAALNRLKEIVLSALTEPKPRISTKWSPPWPTTSSHAPTGPG